MYELGVTKYSPMTNCNHFKVLRQQGHIAHILAINIYTKSIEIKLDVGKYCGCTLSILLIDSNSDETYVLNSH